MSENINDNFPKKKIRLTVPESLQAGAYANNMLISHTKEEFILDFIMIAPPRGTVTSRVILSPGHIKRVVSAIQNSITNYEKKYGVIKEAEGTNKLDYH